MSVIKEIPVFLSKSCLENLLLFEFPNRPKNDPIKDSLITDCKYKPKFHHAELSLGLSTGSANYERHRGQELGRLAPEQFPRGVYDRQLMRSRPGGAVGSDAASSSQRQLRRSAAAVARFYGQNQALVLCPVPPGGRLVMQPVLEHLDTRPAADASAAAIDAEAAAAEAKAVTLRFARQETPEARQRREQSHRACQRMLEQEPWISCRWTSSAEGDPDPFFDASRLTESSSSTGLPMETEDTEDPDAEYEAEERGWKRKESAGVNDTCGGYLSRLCPPVPPASTASDASMSSDSAASSVSLARLRAMPCEERLRALLKSACVLRWVQLVDLLKQCGMTHGLLTESLAQIHGHLTDLACLVRGLWVVKSEVLYPAGTVSMYSGVPSEVLCRGRDYILCRFAQGRTVTRKEVASLVKMPSEEISQILTRISRLVRQTTNTSEGKAPKMRLAFVSEEDSEYVRRNPDVVKKAQYYWDAKWKLLSDHLKLDKPFRHLRTTSISADGSGGGGGGVGGSSAGVRFRRSRTHSARYSTGSSDYAEGAVSDSSLSSAASALQQQQHHRGGTGQVRRRRRSSRMLSTSSVSGTAGAARSKQAGHSDPAATPAPTSTSAPVVPAGPASSPIQQSRSAAPPAEELERRIRGFLRAKLQDRMVAGLDELVRFFRAEFPSEGCGGGGGDSGDKAGLLLTEEAYRHLFDSAAESLGIFTLPGSATGSGRLYSMITDSQPLAAYRRELLEALRAGGSQVTLVQLRARFEKAGLDPLTENSFKTLIKEYCTFRGKAYFAKGYQHAS